MSQINTKRVYNILSVSWGGALAIEIARILETENVKTNLYFVDSAPDTIQSAIAHLNDGAGRDVNLLCKLLNIVDNEVSTLTIFTPLQTHNWPVYRGELDFAISVHKNVCCQFFRQ